MPSASRLTDPYIRIMTLTDQEKSLLKKYFESDLADLDVDDFKKKKKLLQARFHPDKYEKYDNEEVREMAKEKYQSISQLCERVEAFFNGDDIVKVKSSSSSSSSSPFGSMGMEIYATEGLLIEIVTKDKELKYRMFGSGLKWMLHGEAYIIKETNAKIRLWDTSGQRAMGFNETIKLTLSFSDDDDIQVIIDWLFTQVMTAVDVLIINKEKVAINRDAVSQLMRKSTIKLLS